jgi:hypothetical protein
MQGLSLENVAKQLTSELDYPIYTVDTTEPSAANLVGQPVKPPESTDNDDDVEWVDGTFTKAVRSSQTEPTILVIPDITTLYNDPNLLTFTHSVIDTQTNVISPNRTHYIEGNAHNLIVLAGIDDDCDLKNDDGMILRSLFVHFDLDDDTLTDTPTSE